jgi:hypothetical protein
VLAKLHFDDAGGHFVGDTTTHKVIRANYYWPTFFKDSHTLSRKCIICQKAAGWVKKVAFPLHPVMVDIPF